MKNNPNINIISTTGEIVEHKKTMDIPDGWRECNWVDLVNSKTKFEKHFLHFTLVNKLGLVQQTPAQYNALKRFTFYKLEAQVGKTIEDLFTFYLTNYDVREDKGGAPDGIIPDNCWCLFTFYKGKRGMIFLNIEMLAAMSLEAFNQELQKMFKRLQ